MAMTSYFLRLYRRNPIVRWAVALAVFGAVLAMEYLLAAIPFVPVDLQDTGKFAPAIARAADQAVVIGQPIVAGSSPELVSHDGRSHEVVDAYFDQARLADESLALFKGLGLSPPISGAAVDYVTESSGKEDADGPTCRTSVQVLGDGIKAPTSFSFFQHETASSDRYRSVEMKADGAEVRVRLNTVVPFPADGGVPACRVLLKVGDWKQALGGSLGITLVAVADSDFRFRFESLAKKGFPHGSDGLLEPFALGAGEFLEARSLQIDALDGGQPPVLSAQSPADKGPLRLEHLKLGSDQLQITALGKARVTVGGHPWTVDVLDKLTKSPLLATLIAVGNSALFTWLKKVLHGGRKVPKPDTEAARPQRKRRRREEGIEAA
jgi:hypothetical protein